MSKVRIVQFSCIAASIIGCMVMGCHLFLDNGISHPTHVLTVSAAVILAGLIGNAVCAFIRYAQEKKSAEMTNNTDEGRRTHAASLISSARRRLI